MALFILLLFLLNPAQLFGSQSAQDIKVVISPPTTKGVAQFRVDETLNLTCSISSNVPSDVHLEWTMPSKAANSQNKVDILPGMNSQNMVIRNLQENDSGDYKCTVSSNTDPDLMLEKSIRINVKQRKSNCAEMMFRCSAEMCIHKRFICDGKKDCLNGADEDEAVCGSEPCRNKLSCADGRCIPHAWCCDPINVNCTSRAWLPCCAGLPCCAYPLHDDVGFTQETQRYDVAFFQTTVYTVIGCAMAFMFIVTILVIAICRVHMRRTMMPRCPASNRALNCRPASHFNGLPFYDLDVLFNRPSDVMSVNPLLVTYNINNGVQFVGRPVDPPPYCEIVATPPREGPPPPYASHENLALRRVSRTEVPEQDGEEPRESDCLLPRTQPQSGICVISNNNIDTDDTRTTFVVNMTDNEQGGSPMLTVVETQISTTPPTTSSQPPTITNNNLNTNDTIPSQPDSSNL